MRNTVLDFTAILIIPDVLLSQENESSRPMPPGLTVEMLEMLPDLPGGLAPLPDVQDPPENLRTTEKIRLGRQLFFDKRLSFDRTMSCATCHDPYKGFADEKRLSVMPLPGAMERNTPSVINTGHFTSQMWDGRAHTLEEQGQIPILSRGEMKMPDVEAVAERLGELIEYTPTFKQVFGAPPSVELVAQALSAYQRTLVSEGSRFDQYLEGNRLALTEEEKKGLALFVGRASCTQCHKGPALTDGLFHNVGVQATEGAPTDPGRMGITGNEADRGAFRTPGLRNVEETPPYMHNGSLGTLEDVIDFYNEGGGPDPNRSDLIFPLELSEEEKGQLVAFLKSLTGEVLEVDRLDANHEAADTESLKSLVDYMQKGIHDEFTFLSYTIWHDQPLTGENREMIRQAAERLADLAEGIPGYRQSKKVHRHAELLAKTSRELAMEAPSGSQTDMELRLDTVRQSCVDCHHAHGIELFP